MSFLLTMEVTKIMFFLDFLFCNILIAVLFGFFMLIKRLCAKHMTADSRYRLWYLFILTLIFPLIPYKFAPAEFSKIHSLLSSPSSGTDIFPTNAGTGNHSLFSLGLSDFAPNLDHSGLSTFNLFFGVLWGIGFLITVIHLSQRLWSLYLIRRNAALVTAENESDLFSHYISCRQELHIRRKVPLYTSCQIESPLSYGILFPKILIPQDMDIQISADKLRFIFLHELQHYRRKDALLNEIACILQTIYWFNPVVRHGFHLLQEDRELACDHSVLSFVGREKALDYAHTLLQYAEQVQRRVFLSPFSRLSENKGTLFFRIQAIANYQTDPLSRKIKSLGILILVFLLVIISSPLLNVYALSDDTYTLTEEQVETLDLSTYFQGKQGTFVLYDIDQDCYQIYNQKLSVKRISPDSTFKIYSGLFALQEELIAPTSSEQEWNGQTFPFDSWNQNQTLSTALKNSVNWYFQNLDTQMGYHRLSSYYNKISYGNCDLSAGLSHYWSESSLKISAVEQAHLLSNLWNNQWGFEEENIQAVKDAMYLADTPLGKLYGKTGTGQKNGQNVNGWFVGFLERDEGTYSFALNLQDSPNTSGNTAAKVTIEILHNLFSA